MHHSGKRDARRSGRYSSAVEVVAFPVVMGFLFPILPILRHPCRSAENRFRFNTFIPLLVVTGSLQGHVSEHCWL